MAPNTTFVPFFNIPAATITVTSRLAERNQSPWVLSRCTKHGDIQTRTWTFRVGPVLENFAQGDVQEDATRLNAQLEESLRQVPDQYLWMHYDASKRDPAGGGLVLLQGLGIQ